MWIAKVKRVDPETGKTWEPTRYSLPHLQAAFLLQENKCQNYKIKGRNNGKQKHDHAPFG